MRIRRFRSTRCSLADARRLLCAGALATLVAGCASIPEPPRVDTIRQANAKYEIGVDHLNQGRNAMAIRELKQALDMRPGDAWTLLALAEAYRRRNLFPKAEEYLLEAVNVAPDNQPARLNLSALYIAMGRYADAIPHAQALADDPTFPAPWRALTNLGWAHLKLGDLAAARRAFELALEFRPTYPVALLDLGLLESQQGNRLEAMRLFSAVLEQRPGPQLESEADYRIAEILISLGKRDTALQHLTAAVSKSPESEWGKRSAEYLAILK